MSTKTIKAEIVSIGTETKTRKSADPLKPVSQYKVCTVKFLEGRAAGLEYFAQRTTTPNSDGVVKSEIVVGQKVVCYMTVADNTPFFEISASNPNLVSGEDLMALLAD